MHAETAAASAGTPDAPRPSTGGSSLSVMHAWDDHERATLVALLRTRPDGLTWPELAAEVADAHSAHAVWERHHVADLFSDGDQVDVRAQALADVIAWRQSHFRFQTFMDGDYPARLLEVHQFPPVLFSMGQLEAREVGVSVVGSRLASERGLGHARELAQRLAEIDVTVISGLAAGIDTAAHESALKSGGRTVAVIGTGVNKSYPAHNAGLQEQISTDGLVISQFWPDSPPSKSSFPMRNATMSAYGPIPLS
jgi:DNA processing protein